MCESSDRSHDDGTVLNIQFSDRIIAEPGSLEAILIESIRVDKNHGSSLEPLCVGLECGRVHCHKKVTIVTWSGDMLAADVYLEAGNS